MPNYELMKYEKNDVFVFNKCKLKQEGHLG